MNFASSSDHEDSAEVASASKDKSKKSSKHKESASASSESSEEVSDYQFDKLADEPLKTPQVDPKDELDDDAIAVSSSNSKETNTKKAESSSSSEELDDSKPSSMFADGYTGLDSMDGDKPETVF